MNNTTLSFPEAARLPGRALVVVTLGDNTQRAGQLLADRGDKLTVEYRTPAGHFACREFNRSAVAILS
jgi:hypothetical protein